MPKLLKGTVWTSYTGHRHTATTKAKAMLNDIFSNVYRFGQVNTLINQFLVFGDLAFTLSFQVLFSVSSSISEKLIA